MKVVFLILALAFCGPVQAQNDDTSVPDNQPTIRAYVEPENGILVGQTVRFWVEIISPNPFSKVPQFPDLQIEGAIAFLPEQLGVNFSSNEHGVSMVGNRQRYVIIPQRGGTLRIPGVAVSFDTLGEGGALLHSDLETDPIEVTAEIPPGMEGFDQILTTEKLTVTESYDRETDGLKVGDAITRVITLTGQDTFALALPKVEFAEVPGARVYAATPEMTDKTNRGQYSATRISSATYVLEQAGNLLLPGIEVIWFDPVKKTLKTSVLPELGFDVAENPEFEAMTAPANDQPGAWKIVEQRLLQALIWVRGNIIWLTLAAVGVTMCILIWRRFWPVIARRRKDRQDRKATSEAHYFREFGRAATGTDDRETAAGFWRWIDSLPTSTQTRTMHMAGLSEAAKSAGVDLNNLAGMRYGQEPTADLDGRALYQIAKNYRRSAKQPKQSRGDINRSRLNPG